MWVSAAASSQYRAARPGLSHHPLSTETADQFPSAACTTSRQILSASATRLLSSIADRPCDLAFIVLTGDRSILGYGEMWPIGSALRWIMHSIWPSGWGLRGSLKRSCANVIRRFPDGRQGCPSDQRPSGRKIRSR